MKLSSIACMLMSGILIAFSKCAQGYTVHGCKDGHVLLNCRSGTIVISDVILADSSCYGSRCCPRDRDCKGAPSDGYRNSVLSSCNGRSSCVVNVEIRSIGCSVFAPRNDYVNISYECQVAATSVLPSILPRVAVFTEPQRTSKRTTGSSAEVSSGPIGRSTVAEVEKQDEDDEAKSTDRLEVEKTSLEAKPASEFQRKTNDQTLHGEKEALKQTHGDHESQNQDRMTVMTALIVGGIVVVTTVISAAVVMALKKRRIPKTEEKPYEMPGAPTGLPVVSGTLEDNCRSSNFYDFIPDFRDSGNCSGREEEDAEAMKENEYLKPMTEDEEHPYFWVP